VEEMKMENQVVLVQSKLMVQRGSWLDQNMSTGEELQEEAQGEMVLLKLKVQMVLS